MNIENKKPSDITKEQFHLVLEQLGYAAEHSPFYRELFQNEKLQPEKITSLEDFRKIPITTKEDLQEKNEDFISVPRAEIIDLVTTSGTLGKPVSFALNEADLQRLAENEKKSFEMVGITKHDTVQLTTTLDRRFMAGMAYFLGLRKLGAGIVRSGSGLPALQWESISRFQPDYLVAVPSFLLKMIAFAKQEGIDYKKSSVKGAICIGEPLRDSNFELNALGQKIKEAWDIELFSTYASTEMATAFTECKEHTGNHNLPELIFAEILDKDGNEVEIGKVGELVVTPLQTKTMPLLRFATGDMVRKLGRDCNCGRNSLKISTPVGRKKQMLKLKGTSLYPQQIIECLNAFEGLDSFIIEAWKDEFENDKVLILIPENFTKIEILKAHLQAYLKVIPELQKTDRAKIEVLKFPRASRKPVLFRDLRA